MKGFYIVVLFIGTTAIYSTNAINFLEECYYGEGGTGRCQIGCAEDNYCQIVLCLGHLCRCSKCGTHNIGNRSTWEYFPLLLLKKKFHMRRLCKRKFCYRSF